MAKDPVRDVGELAQDLREIAALWDGEGQLCMAHAGRHHTARPRGCAAGRTRRATSVRRHSGRTTRRASAAAWPSSRCSSGEPRRASRSHGRGYLMDDPKVERGARPATTAAIADALERPLLHIMCCTAGPCACTRRAGGRGPGRPLRPPPWVNFVVAGRKLRAFLASRPGTTGNGPATRCLCRVAGPGPSSGAGSGGYAAMVTGTEHVRQLAQDLRDAAADLEAGRLGVANAQAAGWGVA